MSKAKAKCTDKTFTLTEDDIKKIAKASAAEALKEYIKNEKNEYTKRQDRRLYNMRILLENYRSLNEYAREAVYNVDQMVNGDIITEEEVKLLMSCGLKDDDMLVKSVATGAIKVKALMGQVNKMLDIYRNDCETSSSKTKQRRYRVIRNMYLDEERISPKEIAEQEGEDIRTIQNDAKVAREELMPLIFGIEGILNKIFKEES